MKVRIIDIKVRRRVRKGSGDISDLVESIRCHGLLNPVTVTEKLELVAGFRRIKACRALGMEEIECRIVTSSSRMEMLLMEADENLVRKDLTKHDLDRFEGERRYLQARGFVRIRLWILRLFGIIIEWIRGLTG
ncbi:MAG: chromosome partitioning protein ParB [Chrysiogenales bacterium]|nr:MAG: chromosome partitioning protein ParB [Chrysiogenales bacterium]